MAENKGQEFRVGERVRDAVDREVGVVVGVDYDEGFEDYVYGVRFADGSERAYADVALVAAE